MYTVLHIFTQVYIWLEIMVIIKFEFQPYQPIHLSLIFMGMKQKWKIAKFEKIAHGGFSAKRDEVGFTAHHDSQLYYKQTKKLHFSLSLQKLKFLFLFIPMEIRLK